MSKLDQRLYIKINSALSLRSFFLLGLYMLIFLSPFWRGLFFEQDLLPAVMLASIAFLLCIADQFLTRDADFFRDPLDIAMLALLLVYLLSIVTAVHRHDAIVELLKISSFVMVYWMAVRAGKNERDFERLLLVAYLAAVGMAIIGLGAALGWVHFEGAYEEGHIRSTLQYHNALAIYLAAMNVVGLAMSIRTAKLLPRLAFMGGNYLLVMVILGSLSRGTWLLYPLAMGAFIFLIPVSYRRKAVYQLLIFLGTVLLFGRFFFNNLNKSNTLMAVVFLILGLLLSIAVNMIKFPPLDFSNQLAKKGVKKRPLLVVSLIGLVLLSIFAVSNPSSLTGIMRHVLPDAAIARAQKTSVQDTSFQERLATNGDALKIIKDHPLTGVGGGGWKALYHSYASRLYWVNEVHNYYLQTMVEAGIPGIIALLAVAFFFLRLLLRARSSSRDKPDDVLLWAAAVAVLIIAIHSSFDFELSMAAVGFMFYALIGAIRGRISSSALLSGNVNRQNITEEKRQKHYIGKRLLISFLFAVLLALITGIIAFCFNSASQQGEKGAQALETGRLDQAQTLYHQASNLDPYNGTYQVNLAKIAAIKATKGNNNQSAAKAIDYAHRASELEPYDPSLRNALFSIYGTLGRTDLQLIEDQAMIRMNPFLPEPYEQLSATVMKAAWPCLDKGQREEAFSLFNLLVSTREKMPVNTANSTPGLNLAAGQSALILGEIDLSRNYLNLAAQGNENIRKTAELWLAGLDYISSPKRSNGVGTTKQEIDLTDLLAFLKKQK